MLGVGTYAFRWSIGMRDRVPARAMTPTEIVDAARDAGLELVQFADNLPLHILSDEALSELGRHASNAGIALELGMQGFDPALTGEYLRLAELLGAPLIRIALDAEDARRDVVDIADAFRLLLPACRKAGTRLAIENHFHVPSPKLVEIVRTVDDPMLGVCLDVANSICAHEWPEDTIALLAPYAINLHLKDYRIQPDPYGVGFRIVGVPLGDGSLDIDALFERLGASGRSVNVILEHWLPYQGDSETTLRMEREWLARSAAKARDYVG